MSKIIIDPTDIIEEDEGWLLLARRTFNDRTVICWQNGETKEFNIALFNLERSNTFSLEAKDTRWGFMTHWVEKLTQLEATEISNKFLKDLEQENIWWEKESSSH